MTDLRCDLESAVPEWVIEYPETLKVFEELGIDYSCAGKSLRYACSRQGLEAAAVLVRLQQCLDSPKNT